MYTEFINMAAARIEPGGEFSAARNRRILGRIEYISFICSVLKRLVLVLDPRFIRAAAIFMIRCIVCEKRKLDYFTHTLYLLLTS